MEKYWDHRHAEFPDRYEASWSGDTYARYIELEFIKTCLSRLKTPPRVLELGCGAYTLDEAGIIPPDALGTYVGVDGSIVAVDKATKNKPNGFFLHRDLNQPIDIGPSADLVICRRLIQNLDPDQRGWIFPYLAKFKAGILLECTVAGMQKTNILRARNGHPPLTEPEHNKYLTASEVGRLTADPAVEVGWPMGYYYYLTRGILNTRNDYHAYSLHKDSPGFQYGPLQSFTWGLDA